MKITCISDTHYKHRYIDPRDVQNCDVLIHAGDFTGNGNQAQTIAFLQWFESLEVEHKILVAGNHDFFTCSDGFQHLLDTIAPSIIYLKNSSTTINGINFWGSPYSNIFGHWAYMKDDLELADIWETIPNNTHVVITHGPAYGINDLVVNAYDRDPHVGSKALTQRLSELPSLKAHISGHIHEAYGITMHDYLSINASICDLPYVPFNKPITFNLPLIKDKHEHSSAGATAQH